LLPPEEIEALDARWSSCWTPNDVAHHLTGIATPWYVAAGWALDLFRGTQTRVHGDIEIGIPAARFPEVRDRFPGYVFDAVGSGRIWEDASPDALAAVHQTWIRDPATGNYLLDVFREPHDGDTWICRRDETIRLPYSDIIRSGRRAFQREIQPYCSASFGNVPTAEDSHATRWRRAGMPRSAAGRGSLRGCPICSA
jgi:hypothetical protein